MVSVTIDRRDGLNSAAAIKGPCRVATTANITLSGLQTVDGVALAEGDRVLVKDQTDARDNGIRIASTGNWERAADFRNSRDVVTGTQVFVTSGTVSADRMYRVSTTGAISIGTTSVAFTFSDALAAAEAAQAAAEAAAASVNIKEVDDRVELKALNTAVTTLAFIREDDREGPFKWTAGDYSTQIAADTSEGIYVKANAIASTAGAWVRHFDGAMKPGWFGALGGTTDDQDAIQAAWDAGAAATTMILMGEAHRSAGQLTTEENLHVKWNNGAWTYQTGPSATGSFIQTMRPNSTNANSIQNNILLENPQVDGSLFPAPVELEVASSTATTLTFTSAASAVDDFYVGLLLQDMGGTNEGGLRIVTDYDGATRTATHTTAWSSNPTAGAKINVGWNDNGFGAAAGVSSLYIRGGFIKNYPANMQVPAATGGKGINFEQGVSYSYMDGVHVEACGTAFFVQGLDGTYTNGAKRRASGILLTNLSARNVGSFITVAGVNSSADPDGDSDDSMIVINGGTYENAGHSPWRIIPSDPQKSGILNFLEAQNVSISDIRGRNDGTYPDISPGYPTDYAARCGYGLSGNIGAMIWGWGRNLKINGFVHSGNVDNVIVVRRGRALGDDAGGGVPGAPQNCFDWDFRGIEHHGVINEYVIRIDPTAGFRVANNELTGQIEVAVNDAAVTLGLIDPNMAGFTAITLTIRGHVGGKTIIGTPAQIYAAGNTFASFGAGTTDLRKVDRVLSSITAVKTPNITDDGVYSWAVPSGATSFELVLHLASSSAVCRATYFNSTWVVTQPLALIETSASVLTGTTGTDTKVTLSFNSGTIYVENRLGTTYAPYIIPHYYG